MRFAVYLPLVATMALVLASPLSARTLAPARAAASLTAAAVATAVTSVWALLLVAATLAGDTSAVREDAYRRGVALADPVPGLVAIAAAALLVTGLVRAVRVVHRRHTVTAEARALSAACPPMPTGGGPQMAVAPTDAAHAFAVPGRRGSAGWILVTRGMLRALTGPQRRVLMAHERAHLFGRHHWYRMAVEVGAALNPMLIPIRETVAYLVERAADEQAASTVGDRATAARALATAAQAGTRASRAGYLLGYRSAAVPRRVAALLAAPPPERRFPMLALLVVASLAAVAASDATLDFARMVGPLLPF